MAQFDHARPRTHVRDRLKVLGEHACAAGTVPCVVRVHRREAKNLGRVARRAHAIYSVAYGSGPASQDARSTVGTRCSMPCSASEQRDDDAQGDERHSAEHQ